jgi:hypothetical protein
MNRIRAVKFVGECRHTVPLPPEHQADGIVDCG